MYFIRKAKVQDVLRRSGMSLICTEEWETGDVHDVLYYSKKVEGTPLRYGLACTGELRR